MKRNVQFEASRKNTNFKNSFALLPLPPSFLRPPSPSFFVIHSVIRFSLFAAVFVKKSCPFNTRRVTSAKEEE